MGQSETKNKSHNRQIRMIICGIFLIGILLYAICLKAEKYAVSHVVEITIVSCDNEKLAYHLNVPVYPVDPNFIPNEDSLLFQSCIRVKSFSPLPSFYQKRNTCFSAVASKTGGRIKITMYYIFLDRSYRVCEYEINHAVLWETIVRKANEKNKQK